MSIFKRKKDKFPKIVEPRTLDSIKQEYAELRAKAGDIQYQLYVFAEDLKQVNARLLAVNKEGNERMELDATAAKAVAKTAPVETSQQ